MCGSIGPSVGGWSIRPSVNPSIKIVDPSVVDPSVVVGVSVYIGQSVGLSLDAPSSSFGLLVSWSLYSLVGSLLH